VNCSLRSSIRRALLLAAVSTVAGVTAAAQTISTAPLVQEIEVVVVTGSYIQGTVQDAALPVQVITLEDLEKQGSPTMVELVKSIPAVQGVVGESNQFSASTSGGVSNINLRGLGAVRTLVLLNGRRIAGTGVSGGATATTGIGVDLNLIPAAAIGRIEVLRDGASATYGSDAIGGVVNLITRKGVDGVSLDGAYTYIEGSDGDYSSNMVWGYTGETYDFMVTAGYRHRSELAALDRDFAIRSFTENPQGGFSSFGNPGVYQLLNPAGTAPIGLLRDPACATLGGVETGAGLTVGCQFQFTQFDNLVEREEHYNFYSEFNSLLGGGSNLHVEAFYAGHDTPEENSSPSYAPTQGSGATISNPSNAPNYFIPLSNPGLAALLPALTAAQQAAISAAGGVRASGLQWRPLGNGGNPLTGEGKKDERAFDSFRLSTSVEGELKGVGWNVALTYSESKRTASTPDILVTQLDRALRGFGGPNCTGTVAGSAANGCSYFNPFSTGIALNPALGLVNPALGNGGTFVASTVNDPEVVRALFSSFGFDDTSKLAVFDTVFNGESDLRLPGGKVSWALGLQYRDEATERNTNDDTNLAVNPCPDTPLNGNVSCAAQTGPLSFMGTANNVDVSSDVYGVFAELSLPVLESLQAQVAYRYEDYGGNVGSTSNPKLSVRWQAANWLGLRASAGSTFRGPQAVQLLDEGVTTNQFTSLASPVQNLSGFRPVDNFGNPNLKPEDADTLNAGVFFTVSRFTAALDYFAINLKDPLVQESGPALVAELFGTATARENHCGEAAFAALQARFSFAGGVCAPQNLLRTRAKIINGPDEHLAGIDASLQQKFSGVLNGELTLGLDASYLLKYERDRLFVEGVEIENAGGRDFAGTRGLFLTLPQLRGSVYLDWAAQSQNLRLTSRYIDGMTDLRPATANPVTGKLFEVGSFLTHDLVYRVSLPSETTLTASALNFTDRDPPLARLELNYDPFITNPIGRSFKVALSKRF
jgi:iron complex outermembrane recepter protein